MPKAKPKPHIHYHKDGAVWARGQLNGGGVMTGHWEWFRKDGSKMRAGSFDERGRQIGEWTTFDKKGKVVKVTKMKVKS